MEHSLIFSPSDELWSRMRKACSHAFYKDHMEKMMEVLKEKLANMIAKWNDEISSSSEGKTIVDLALVFEQLFCKHIVHICFGEDVSDMLVETAFHNDSKDGPEWVTKKVPLRLALNEFSR